MWATARRSPPVRGKSRVHLRRRDVNRWFGTNLLCPNDADAGRLEGGSMTTPLPPDSLPVRPDLGQMKRQAKELLAGIRAGEPAAVSKLAQFHVRTIDPASTKLA